MKPIMMKHDNELINKKVFLAQQFSQNQGNFLTLLTKDLSDLNI